MQAEPVIVCTAREGPGMTYPERLGDVWDQPGMELEWKYLKEAQL